MTDYTDCHVCGREAKVTPTRKLGKHDDADGATCPLSGKPLAEDAVIKPPMPVARSGPYECPCGTRTFKGKDGAVGVHPTPGRQRCQYSNGLALTDEGKRMLTERQAVNEIEKAQADMVAYEQDAAERAAHATGDPAILASYNPGKEVILAAMAAADPTPPSQEEMMSAPPRKRAAPRKRAPLDGRAAEVSAEFDEMFFAYQHARPRSLQPTIGPSEVGSDCMRKIAMKLSQMPEVNYEKDSWPAWVGTQGHSGLEEMLAWYNESTHTNRFLIEVPLEFGSLVVPRGHSDAFDRVHGQVRDWKFPGKSSLSKMHLDGCPNGYRVQLHIYGYGAERAGETVREVALVALPREGGSLADKYVFVEPYDRDIAVAAIQRAENIGRRLDQLLGQGVVDPWRQAPKTPDFLCNWCSYHLPNDDAETNGCNGKKGN